MRDAQSENPQEQLPIDRQVDALIATNGEYNKILLGDLVDAINTRQRGERFNFAGAAVYISRHRSNLCAQSLDEIDGKNHESIFQIVVNPRFDAGYLAAYLASELGQRQLDAASSGANIQRISKNVLLSLKIPVPPIAIQQQISSVRRDLAELERSISGFSSQIALDPGSALAVRENVSGMLDAIGKLSLEEVVRASLRSGESKTVEFKETLSLCLRSGKKEKYIEHASLKTIAAFMNTDGGTLLVGISDDGGTPGLQRELERFYRNSNDRLLLHFKTIFKERIGEIFYPYMDSFIVRISGMQILAITCRRSNEACFVDGDDFFVRTNPATDQLKGRKMVKYIDTRFKNS